MLHNSPIHVAGFGFCELSSDAASQARIVSLSAKLEALSKNRLKQVLTTRLDGALIYEYWSRIPRKISNPFSTHCVVSDAYFAVLLSAYRFP
jgi:hypothetical protein